MRNYSVCILDKDIHYAKAFLRVVAIEHAGINIRTRTSCGADCDRIVDVCISFGDMNALQACEKAFSPVCGKYAGVTAILCEARKAAFDRAAVCGRGAAKAMGAVFQDTSPLGTGTLLCVYSYTGGAGTSCAAIGIGRELSRYRGERVLYLSIEDAEDRGLFPAGLGAMRAEEILYRYMRLADDGAGKEGYERLFRAAAARDEYGLYRLAPDEGAGSLASLGPDELYAFSACAAGSLELTRIVMDFGTRLRFVTQFPAVTEGAEAFYLEVRPEGEECTRKRRTLFSGGLQLSAFFPLCDEDIRSAEGYTEVGIANAFGLSVKEICDRIAAVAI